MKKTPLYTYLGTNGTITTPIHLEGIYCVIKYRLEAEINKVLTKDDINFVKTVVVPEEEVDLWREVYKKVNQE